ncbi:MAG: DUF6445 family protein [Gemmatimonadaceae bacterium]
MEVTRYHRFVLAKDAFYENPAAVYRAAQRADYHEPEGFTGFRSTAVYHEPGIKQKLQRILGIRITRWDTDPVDENGVFYMGLSSGKRKEVPGVHSDLPWNDMTIVIYLTPGLPVDCGTSLWMHRKTGLTDPPSARDAKRLGKTRTQLLDILERDNRLRARWVEVDRIGYGFNRMVAFPSGILHSASRHHGASITGGRVFQTFRVGVDWSSLKLATR